jgi:hypothetical protein
MSDFDPTQFGTLMEKMAAQYRSTYAWVAIVTHVIFLVLFVLILRFWAYPH